MPRRYIPALILVLGLAISTIYLFNKETAYIKGMAVASGKVVALGNKSTSTVSFSSGVVLGKNNTSVVSTNSHTTNTQALVDFSVSGSTYRSEGRGFGYPKWRVGQAAEVYYSSDNPKINRIKRFDEVYFYSIISAFFLSFCILFGSINYLVYKIRGRPLS